VWKAGTPVKTGKRRDNIRRPGNAGEFVLRESRAGNKKRRDGTRNANVRYLGREGAKPQGVRTEENTRLSGKGKAALEHVQQSKKMISEKPIVDPTQPDR